MHAIKNKLSQKTGKMVKTSSFFFFKERFTICKSIFWKFQSWWKSDKKKTATKVFPKQIQTQFKFTVVDDSFP